MAVSEAHTRASVKWNKSRDNIMIRPTKEDGARIRFAASNSGKSVQQFVLDAVAEKIARDFTDGSGDDYDETPKEREKREREAARWATMTKEEMATEEARLESKPFEELPLETREAFHEIEEMERTGGGPRFSGTASELTRMLLSEGDE